MILSVYQRANSDERSLGELFWSYVAEVSEISFDNAFYLIIHAMLETVKAFFHISDEQMVEFMEAFINRLPKHLQGALRQDSEAA